MAPNRFPSGISKVIQMLRVKTLEMYVNMYICVYGSHLPSTGFLILNFFLMLDKAKKKTWLRLFFSCESPHWYAFSHLMTNLNRGKRKYSPWHLSASSFGHFPRTRVFQNGSKKKRAAHLVYVCIYYIL